MRCRRSAFSFIVVLVSSIFARAEDWPQWRCDAYRSAASTEELPARLQLRWSRSLSPRTPVWDEPLNRDLMPYDRIFEPVVAGGRMFVGFNDRDKLVAYDARTGAELWSFRADGPVRLPPAAWSSWVYFCSDDGHLYCLDAASGELRWKFRATPSERKVLGNRRLISAWPARGGPVVRDGRVYFAGGIWPFMGIFLVALDAESGAVVWINDGEGHRYLKQPHGAPSFAGIAPQGALVATKELLLVPGGRSRPAAFDLASGELLHFHHNIPKGSGGGSFVVADEQRFFVHTRGRLAAAFDLRSGDSAGAAIGEPVLFAGALYAANGRFIQASAERKKWTLPIAVEGDLIKAGSRLYAAGEGRIVALGLPRRGEAPRIEWSTEVDGEVLRLLAAGGMLYAVTLDGRLLAFAGTEGGRSVQTHHEEAAGPTPSPEALAEVDRLLERCGQREGYALLFGAGEGEFLEALLARSHLHVIAADPDPKRLARLRTRFDRDGLHGSRVHLHPGDPIGLRAPPYIASLIAIDPSLAARHSSRESLEACYRSLRPYGGALWIPCDEEHRSSLRARLASGALPGATSSEHDEGILVRRPGALAGAGEWTHQYGDIANSVKSDDRLVKLPLGLLWFGGNSHEDVLPRHSHGPPQQVIGGRLFIEGISTLSARDVYTGRTLWRTEFEDLGTYGAYYDHSYADTPLEVSYNQRHIPGANARGTNFVATESAVYVAVGSECRVLDAASGAPLRAIPMLENARGQRCEWAFIGVYGDVLLGGTGFTDFMPRVATSGARHIVDFSASRGLAAFDRHSGALLWRRTAGQSFPHNAIVAGGGRIYCMDRLFSQVIQAKLEAGQPQPPPARILALDPRSGALLWERDRDVTGSWLGYSEDHDLLIEAGARARDRLPSEVGQGLAAYEARSGELRWRKEALRYTGPCILHGDTLYTNVDSYRVSAGAFALEDGSPRQVRNPMSGELVPWRFTRAYGCNTAIASEHLLTFRSGAAAYYDLLDDSGTGNFGGLRSGCTSNLIAADGVLNAPDYTRTCQCAYQNQTSMALVHMPEVETWAITPFDLPETEERRIRDLGLNLGAPGDRRAPDGTLWIEYPVVGGASPRIAIEASGEGRRTFCHHAGRFAGEGLSWVNASGMRALESLTVSLVVAPKRGIPVAHRNDDAEEDRSGAVNLASSDLELVREKEPQLVGLRFRGIPLERGSRVRSARIQFTVDETSEEPTRLEIRAQQDDDAPAFGNGSRDLSSRTRTARFVCWEPGPWKRTGDRKSAQLSPDLARLVEEVVSRPGWKRGNALAFLIGGEGKRVAVSFDGEGSKSPCLILEERDSPRDRSRAARSVPYKVRLHFCEPDDGGELPGSVDVYLQGRCVLRDFAPVRAAGGIRRGVVKEFRRIPVTRELQVELRRRRGAARAPALCGVEVHAE